MRCVLAAAAAALSAVMPLPAPAAVAPRDDGRWIVYAVSMPPLVPPAQAPADRYFGVQRLSNLGVRNMVHDMVLEGTSPLALPEQLERIDGVRSALADWQEHYPSDRWLPGAMLEFAEFLQSKQQAFTDDMALGYLYYVRTRYAARQPARWADQILATYAPVAPFDVSSIPPPSAQASVSANIFPKLHR
jgi:hypothetical protein